MATLLFFNVPAYGHVNPTLPIVTELVQRGHHIIYYNASSFEPVITGAGATFRAYPNSSSSEAAFASRASNLVYVTLFLLEESIRLLPFVLDELAREQADLVMFDSIALWGMQAASLRGTRSVASISTFVQEGVTGMMTWRDYVDMLRHALPSLPAVVRRRRQLVRTYGPMIFPRKAIFPCVGDISLVYTSRVFQPDTPFIDNSFHFVGPSILAATRTHTDFPWHILDGHRPRVYLSLGTLYGNNLAFYRTVFTAFAGHPAQFILAVGHQTDPHSLLPIPDNFIVQPVVPQLELLPKVNVFVTHGGMNSVNEGLYFGVPLVIVPQQIEQVFNARQVARKGAGVALADTPPYGRVDAHMLRHAVDEVLADATYRRNAAQISQSFHEAGGYRQAASVITSAIL